MFRILFKREIIILNYKNNNKMILHPHLLTSLNPVKLQWLWVVVVVTGAMQVYRGTSPHLPLAVAVLHAWKHHPGAGVHGHGHAAVQIGRLHPPL